MAAVVVSAGLEQSSTRVRFRGTRRLAVPLGELPRRAALTVLVRIGAMPAVSRLVEPIRRT